MRNSELSELRCIIKNEKNLIPHYGTAISEYSEAVAKKCGFKESYRQHYADVKFKLISL